MLVLDIPSWLVVENAEGMIVVEGMGMLLKVFVGDAVVVKPDVVDCPIGPTAVSPGLDVLFKPDGPSAIVVDTSVVLLNELIVPVIARCVELLVMVTLDVVVVVWVEDEVVEVEEIGC